MKKLLVFFFIMLPCLCAAQISDMHLYQLAVNEIKTTYAFEKYATKEPKGLQVMAQLVPLSHMGEPFYKELLRETGVDYNLDENWGSMRKNRSLPSLSDASKSTLKLFFSRINEDTFLAELISDTKYRDWEKATLNSPSITFLLSHAGGRIIILDSSENEDD